MLNWFYNWIAKRSELYQKTRDEHQTEVRIRVSLERENFGLREELKEKDRDIGDLTTDLEIQREEREKANNLVGLVKSAKAKLERTIRRYTPTEVVYNMVETSDQPCVVLTPDLAILKGNKASKKEKTFREIPLGKSLLELELIEEEEIVELRKRAIASTAPFEYQPKKFRLNNWSIIPSKEGERVLAYILTKKGFLKRTLEKAQELYAELVGEKKAEEIIQIASLAAQQNYS